MRNTPQKRNETTHSTVTLQQLNHNLNQVGNGETAIDAYALLTFQMILSYLSGKDRDDYSSLKKELLSDKTTYSKSIVNSAFKYKSLKIIAKVDNLRFSTIKKMITAIDKGYITIAKISELYKLSSNNNYNEDMLKLIKPPKKLKKLDAPFDLKSELRILSALSMSDKLEIIKALSSSL